MSPTYWTASQLKKAARLHGWEFIPVTQSRILGAWGARKGRRTVLIREDRRGGLTGVWLTYPQSGRANCDYYGPRNRDKLRVVLDFLRAHDKEER